MTKSIKLKDISTSIGSGITPSRTNKSYWENGEIPWLKTDQLGEHEIHDTNEKIAQTALEETSIKVFPENTLSIAMYGEGKTRGNVSILKRPMTTNQACCNIVIDEKKADYEFVYYLLKTQYLQLRSLSSGVRKNLNSNDIKEFKINLPVEIKAQRQIASVVSSLDSKIALNNRINAELEAMARTVYDYWFVQFDFPNAEGKPYKSSGGKMVWSEELKREIPEGWKVKPISQIIEVKDGTHDSPKPQNEGYRLITSKNLLPSGLDFEGANLISKEDYININKRSKVDTGDILFSMIGSIGVVYKVEEKEIDFAVKNVALYKSSQRQDIRNYIYQYLKSYDMQRYMENSISGSIQKFISLGNLRQMPILIEDSIIKLYIENTEHIYRKLELIKLENQQLSSLRDWLLPMLMNGQVSVDTYSGSYPPTLERNI